jgi:hypothetical protein
MRIGSARRPADAHADMNALPKATATLQDIRNESRITLRDPVRRSLNYAGDCKGVWNKPGATPGGAQQCNQAQQTANHCNNAGEV